MTEKEIFNELKTCRLRVRQLQKEVTAETDFTVANAKLDEMMKLAKRASELDTLNENNILNTIKTKLGLC